MKTITSLMTIILCVSFQLLEAQIYTSEARNYCQVTSPEGNNYITRVSFSEINHISERGVDGYSDFTDKKGYLDQGREYYIEIGTKWGHWPYISIQIWIDWNQDGKFDSEERVVHKVGTTPVESWVQVPQDALIGETRMRVRYNYDIDLEPCEINRREYGEIEDYTIVVTDPRRPRSSFSASSTYIDDDKELIEFSDKSTNNPTSWYWEFEGGIPSVSTEQYPMIRYIRSGKFTVKLTVQNEYGRDIRVAENYIIANIVEPVYPPVADFSTVVTHVTSKDEYVRFDDLSENNPTSWQWVFEGATPSSSTEQIPQVTYSESGTYSVTLIVSNEAGQGVKTKEGYITVDLGENNSCESVNQRPVGQYISRVSFSGVNSVSTFDKGYEFYDLPGSSVERGPLPYPQEAGVIEIKPNYIWENTKLAFWVDWNQDNDFNDVGEQRTYRGPTSTDQSWTTFFVVPEDAKLGKTILRIRVVHGEEILPCGEAWFGETEDYVITVVEPRIEDPIPPVRRTTVSPNPSSDGVFDLIFDEDAQNIDFTVINQLGNVVYNTTENRVVKRKQLNLSELRQGVYNVKVTSGSWSEVVRILINK